jgi:hypothetical protein
VFAARQSEQLGPNKLLVLVLLMLLLQLQQQLLLSLTVQANIAHVSGIKPVFNFCCR